MRRRLVSISHSARYIDKVTVHDPGCRVVRRANNEGRDLSVHRSLSHRIHRACRICLGGHLP